MTSRWCPDPSSTAGSPAPEHAGARVPRPPSRTPRPRCPHDRDERLPRWRVHHDAQGERHESHERGRYRTRLHDRCPPAVNLARDCTIDVRQRSISHAIAQATPAAGRYRSRLRADAALYMVIFSANERMRHSSPGEVAASAPPHDAQTICIRSIACETDQRAQTPSQSRVIMTTGPSKCRRHTTPHR